MPMQRSSRTVTAVHRQDLLGPFGLWLGLGSVVLATGLLPVHSILLGWSAPFWLLLTPLLLMLGLAPELPRQWLDRHRSARLAMRERIWN